MPVYQKEIIPQGPYDFDARLNGAYIGSFLSEALAETELDRVAYEDARRGALLADQPFDNHSVIDLPAANPLIPFGVAGGPGVDLTGLTFFDLCRAAERVADYYERFPLVTKRVISALDIAQTGLSDHQSGKEPAECKWYIADDGTVFVQKSEGTGRYLVNDDMCGCRNYWISVQGKTYAGQGVQDGKCKHTLARELLRLAQAYRGTWPAEGGNQLAHLRVGARPLARALSAAAKTEQPVTISILFFHLRISAGTISKVLDKETDGWGVRTLSIPTVEAAQLAANLSQASKTQPGAAVTLFLDERAGEIDLFGANGWQFAAVVRQAV